jgi:outer membrane protein insertion porin family
LSLGFNVDLSSKQTNFDISLFNPKFRDSQYSLGGNLFSRRYVAYDYTQETTGFGINSGKQLTRHTAASLGYQFSTIRYTDLQPAALDLLVDNPYLYKNTDKSSISPAISYDTTDDYYVPRHGMTAGTSLEFAGLGGQEKFIKSFSKFGYFYGLEDLTGMDIILRYKARLGWFLEGDRSKNVSIGEMFYMGGMGTVRGFQSSSIGAKKVNADGTYTYLGDTKTASNSIEVSIPLIAEAKMRLLTFIDAGMIGTSSITENTRASYGAGIEWLSPMGPIQVYYSKPITTKPGDKTSDIDFSIGTRF